MEQYAGIDVSLESASICVVDATGRVVREAKVACEPEVLITRFGKLGGRRNSDRPGGGSAIAMAICGDARSGTLG